MPVALDATVAFRGNRYSVPHGLAGASVTLRHRLGARRPRDLLAHRAGSSRSTSCGPPAPVPSCAAGSIAPGSRRPCWRPSAARGPASARATSHRDPRRGPPRRRSGRGGRGGRHRPGPLCRTGGGSPMSEDSVYQQLRGHLATLRLAAAAEALPGVLEQAAKAKLGHTALLERLLAIEVAATRPAVTPAWSVSPRCRRPGGSADFDFEAQPSVDRQMVTSSPRCASSRTPPTCCSSDRRVWARRCSRWRSGGPRSRPASAPTTRPRRNSRRVVTAPPSRAAGPPRCASSRDRAC